MPPQPPPQPPPPSPPPAPPVAVVLQQLYESLGGASWLIADGWKPGFSCVTAVQDNWHGTKCEHGEGDGLGTITSLKLVANGLQGTIPTEVGLLPDLQALVIDSNPMVSGTVPTEIGALRKLRTLSLDNNTLISGSLPAELAGLSSLRYLSAHTGALSGTVPQAAVLGRLKYLDLASNAFTGLLPSPQHMANIEYLSLHSNHISGTIATEIGQLASLRDRLYVHTNQISGTLPSELGLMTHVTLPALHENSISGTVPTQLAGLTLLQFPSLSYNLLSGTTPSQLSSWTSLQARLDLASNSIDRATRDRGPGRPAIVPGEQTLIDQAIIDRQQSAASPEPWYAEHCEWSGSGTDGRFQCGASSSTGVSRPWERGYKGYMAPPAGPPPGRYPERPAPQGPPPEFSSGEAGSGLGY